MIFRRYDGDRDGLIKFSEFTQMIQPIEEEHQKYLLDRKPHQLKGEFKEFMFSYKAKKAMLPFFLKVVETEKLHMEIIEEIRKEQDENLISIKQIFNEVDSEEKGFINGN